MALRSGQWKGSGAGGAAAATATTAATAAVTIKNPSRTDARANGAYV